MVGVTSPLRSLRGFERNGLVTEVGSEMNCKFTQTVRILSFQALPSGCIIDFLKQNPPMRQHFLNRIAGPIVNKMFECGMIP
jgi:hypothetical protein